MHCAKRCSRMSFIVLRHCISNRQFHKVSRYLPAAEREHLSPLLLPASWSQTVYAIRLSACY